MTFLVTYHKTAFQCSSFYGTHLLQSSMIALPFSFLPIHQEAPDFVDMSVEAEILVTGIKVVDLLAPYAKGGKIGK